MEILTVTQCNKFVKETLNDTVLKIQGEVSNFKVSQGRFVFFDLKDKSSYVNCFLMAFNLKEKLEEGQEVVITGTPSLFTKSGRFHIAVRSVELVGAGALQKDFERLKRKLEQEGLFSEERKRVLPRFPEKIGIITSEDAAAYTDIMRILKQRFPIAEVYLKPVRVQGSSAPRDIAEALGYFKKYSGVDVVIISRGGGNLEDLQAFNDEEVVRAVFALNIPTVSGVGHERDVTLVDHVADVRAATPTHAAETVVPHSDDIEYQIRQNLLAQKRTIESMLQDYEIEIQRNIQIMNSSMTERIVIIKDVISSFYLGTKSLQSKVSEMVINLKNSVEILESSIRKKILDKEMRLESQKRILNSVDPTSILKRGYSITFLKKKVVKDKKHIKEKDILITRLYKGEIISEVK